MSLPSHSFLVASRRLWRTREQYRYRKWHFYHYDSKRPRAERDELRKKWWKLYKEARDNRIERDRQLADMKRKFVVIDGCPCPRDVAPYIYLVLRRANQTASSIYRGSDPEAKAILHRHGKHTQGEIHAMPQYRNISNPEGLSEHDLHSDGHARPGPADRHLSEWQIGVDSGTDSQHDKAAIVAAAHHYGLSASHPYSRGVEGHHWHFDRKPRADGKHLTKTRVIITRARLALNR